MLAIEKDKDMSGTMTVKELITELLDYDMGEPVYIGLGPGAVPMRSAKIQQVSEFSSNITCWFGVYLTPRENLMDADLYHAGIES
jgi:hypothetical protein